MSVLVVPGRTFHLAEPYGATDDNVAALVAWLAQRGVLLTSYGNVRGCGSLATQEEFWALSARRQCLHVAGVRRIMNNCGCVKPAGRWNRDQPSRALRVLYLETERWLLPVCLPERLGADPADVHVLGHGEFIAAMLMLGYSARFDAAADTGCLFKCRIVPGTEAAIQRARAIAEEARSEPILGISSSEDELSCSGSPPEQLSSSSSS